MFSIPETIQSYAEYCEASRLAAAITNDVLTFPEIELDDAADDLREFHKLAA